MSLRDIRKTKIVCTIGPASDSARMLERLMRAGMNVCRLNFSHGTHDEHREKLRLIRQLEKKLDRPVAVIQDLCGPKIRTGDMGPSGLKLRHGEEVSLSGMHKALKAGVIPVSLPRLARDVKVGDAVLLADGSIELRVARIEGSGRSARVVCKVIVGGVVFTKKGVNIPAEALSVEGLTPKDIVDLEFAVKEDVDFVALSFVRSAQDVERLKRVLARKGKPLPVIAKIEKPQALLHIDEIIASAYGIMVARGDLGVEIPFDQVPVVQKDLIRRANRASKPVITATQMLKSMVESPRPTRAEVTDVANAIWDGADAVMLSEETASGQYPVEAVKAMDRIARTVEREIACHSPLRAPYPSDDPIPDAISYSAYIMAEELQTRAIVSPTRSGATARLISRYRPDPPIVALTHRREVQRQLCLTWGAIPILSSELIDPKEITEQAFTLAKKNLSLKKGDRILITAGTSRVRPGTTDTIRLEQI